MTTIDTTMPGYTTTPVRGTASFNTDMQTRMDEMDANATAINAIASEMNTVAGEVNTNALNAATSASNAATSASNAASSEASAAADAATAADYAGSITATSTSSQTIGTGTKTFTIQSGKQFSTGQFVSIISDADSSNYMHGAVTSYSGTTLVVNVLDRGGSGTYADWGIGLSGSQGPQGVAGTDGYMTHLYTVNAVTASEVVFDAQIDSTYKKYIIECNNAIGGNSLSLRVGYGSTPTYLTSSYIYTLRKQDYSTSTLTISNNSGTSVQAPIGDAGIASYPSHIRIELYDPSTTAVHPIYSQIHRHGIGYNGYSTQNSSTILTAIKIISTTAITGTFKLYGVE